MKQCGSTALGTLPRRQREAVILRYYVDLSETESAAAMGISEGAAKSHTYRGMAALRQRLNEDGRSRAPRLVNLFRPGRLLESGRRRRFLPNSADPSLVTAGAMWSDDLVDADVIVVGAGLAGLAATAELAAAGRRVLLLDQEPESSMGGQAFWSFGGLFLVDSFEQRRMGITDSRELAWQDWLGSAYFDRGADDPAGEDYWAYRWAQAYVDFAAGEKRRWLHAMGVRWFPVVAWAERGGYLADGHGNSVPRFHVTWGTGPAVLAPFERRVREASGLVGFRFRHRVDELTVERRSRRRRARSRARAQPGAPRDAQLTDRGRSVRAARAGGTGVLGRDRRQLRPDPPELAGPARAAAQAHDQRGTRARRREDAGHHRAGRRRGWSTGTGCGTTPKASRTGTRSGRSTASGSCPAPRRSGSTRSGRRCPAPNFPGFDTLGTLAAIQGSGYDHSWFVLTQKILEKEFALSGSEQNPDLTGKDLRLTLKRLRPGAPAPVETFKRRGADFVVAATLPELVDGMNKLTGEALIDAGELERQIVARDREIDNPYTKDLQVMAIRNARRLPRRPAGPDRRAA